MAGFLNIFKIKFRNFDWLLMACLVFFAAASLVSLASLNTSFFHRQLIWYFISFLIIIFGSFIDWRWLLAEGWFRHGFYWICVGLLVFSNLQSGTVRGTKSWIHLGAIQFEPAELMKLALVFLLAGFFSRRYISAWQNKNIFISLLYALIPTFLVAIHPDFGSALVIMSVWIGFLFLSGVNYKKLFIGGIIALTVAVLLWSFFLKPYQKNRVSAFLFPSVDPLGINYNVIQSKIAIGSAGFFGKGFKMGTQTQLGFLPEAKSDFLFAAFVEEWGVFGGLLILLTFFIILLRITRAGLRARNNELKFISLGTGLIFLVHFFINIGSNLGLLPVAGITFPFLSYGGSSLLTSSILISTIEHINLLSR